MIFYKKTILIMIFCFGAVAANAQSSCADMIQMVKSKSYGASYYSYDSKAISQVTFYEVSGDNYKTYYFAIVRFTNSYKEYIYQVSSRTKYNRSVKSREEANNMDVIEI